MSPLTTAKHVLKASELHLDSATVFDTLQIQIVRALDLDLNAGSNVIEITGISGTIETGSLILLGLDDARFADVVCVIDNSDERRAIQDAKAKVCDLKLQKEAHLGEVEGKLVQKLNDEVLELERFIETTQQRTEGETKAKGTITFVAEDGDTGLQVSYIVDNMDCIEF